MTELKKLAEELRSTFESELIPRIEGQDRDTAEVKQAIDRVQDRLDEIETRAQKASLSTERGTPSQERKDLMTFVRKGTVPEDSKVMRIGDQATGGVLAPPDFVTEVIKGIVEFSPIRSIARVRPTSRTSVQAPKRTQTAAAQWAGETEVRTTTTNPQYGLEEIPTHEMYARVEVSNWDLEDPAVDVEADLLSEFNEQFGLAEGTAFVSGNAVTRPEGFLTNADVIDDPVLNGGSTFANGDGVVKLAFSVKEGYWANARYVLNRFSLRDIRLLKDTAGNYLWQPATDGVHGLATGLAPTLNGFPYVVAPDMPSAEADALTVAFGDFKRAYWIPDRLEVQLLRDPFTQATSGAVVFHARKRVGGQVVLPEAINVLKMAAS